MLTKLAPNLMHRVILQRLYLDNCRLTIKGVASLFSSLKTNHSIVALSLACNDFSYPEGEDVPMTDAKDLESNLVEFLTSNSHI